MKKTNPAIKLVPQQPVPIQNRLLDLDNEIRAAHDFALALVWLTETLDEGEGVIFRRMAQTVLAHVNQIDRQVEVLKAAPAD